MIKLPENNKRRNYIIVFLALMYDVSPFFMTLSYEIWTPLFIILFLFVNKNVLLNKKIISFLVVIYILVILQGIIYDGFSPAAIYKPIMLFFTPFLLYCILGKSYFKYLFNLIYFLSVFSVFFWFLNNIDLDFMYALAKKAYGINWDVEPRSILFYTVERATASHNINIIRNAGFLHEPGAFSIYLMFAIIINSIFTSKFFHKKNIILMLILITTFSTTGYLILSLFILYAISQSPEFRRKTIGIATRVLLLTFIFTLIYSAFKKQEFLAPKIEESFQRELQYAQDNRYDKRGRFFSFFSSMKLALKNPIIGRGIIQKTQFEKITQSAAIGYGFAGFFMHYGLIMGILYLVYFYKGFLHLNELNTLPKNFTVIIFALINMALLTQIFFIHLSFTLIFIIGLLEPKRKYSFKQSQKSYSLNLYKQ